MENDYCRAHLAADATSEALGDCIINAIGVALVIALLVAPLFL